MDPGKASKLLICEQPQKVLRPWSMGVSPFNRAFVFEGVAVHTYLKGASSWMDAVQVPSPHRCGREGGAMCVGHLGAVAGISAGCEFCE